MSHTDGTQTGQTLWEADIRQAMTRRLHQITRVMYIISSNV